MTDTNPRPSLAHAHEAADVYLFGKVTDGAMSPDVALRMGTAGFTTTTGVLAGLRREGLSEQRIVDAFQARLDKARKDGDERSTVAAEFALAVWDGMQRDLADYLRSTGTGQR